MQYGCSEMEASKVTRPRCLWHAADGRCASCKARRIRCDVLQLKDYEMCEGEGYYVQCDFYKEKPEAKKLA